ncbi:hypothetical protein ACWXWU_01380 [Shewanella sp. A14]
MSLTYGKIFQSEIDKFLEQFQSLMYDGYSASNVCELVSSLGTKLELFFKNSVFPQKNPRDNLNSFINELTTVAQFRSLDYENFHDFRKIYNKAKHDPNANLDLLVVIENIKAMKLLVNTLVEIGVGDISKAPKSLAKRVYWLSAYDHYIDGDTEVHIIIPGDTDHWLGPPTFDRVNIKLLDWDEVKNKLGSCGVLKDGEEYIPQRQVEILRKDSDFLSAHVWEGEYKLLLRVLTQHELRLNLIAGLNRHDTAHNMQVAFLMATLDVLTPEVSLTEFRSAIKQCAIDYYGVPKEYEHTDHFLDGMISFINGVEADKWENIHGPTWLSEDKFNQKLQSATSAHANKYMLIDSTHTILMKWSAK